MVPIHRGPVDWLSEWNATAVGLRKALSGHGKFDEAVAEIRAAIQLTPDLPEAHVNLGVALTGEGKVDEVSAEFRASIRLKPDLAEAHCNLAGILEGQGDYAGALEMYRKGHELGSKARGS